MKPPRISIVTISFNQAEYLRAAIDSVLGQGYPNLQYIVVDPGSTDGSREIIDSYAERISVKVFEPDRGPGDGLNKGFARADGEIYGYLNADDVLLPGALHTVVEAFARRPDVDVISGHCQIIDGRGQVLRESYSDPFRPNRVLHRAANLMQPSTFFRRRAFNRTSGFNVANRLDWDTELFVDMYAQGAKFARCDAMLSGYRLHTTTVTAQRRNSLILAQDWRKLLEAKLGRAWAWYDHLLRWGYLVLKYLGNPRWVRERLLRGRVAGRSG
ncbi:MAG: glycosyltransferase [Planctomycetota bacterium]|nr:MAG: glycosyltransferase [Planctomycetota bacterium]